VDLSIIIPFVGEFPQVLFTIQAVAQQFIGRIDFEIVAINNFIPNHPRIPAGTEDPGPMIACTQRGNPWLKYVEYKDELSHWQAKWYGITKSSGKHLLFVDSHVIPARDSLYAMYNAYVNEGYCEKGSMHLPLTYKILEYHRSIYKLVVEHECFYSYSFTGCPPNQEPFEVPCMSTCGMILSREIYDKIGGWPRTLTTYGGGENFLNFTLGVCGYEKWIYPGGTLHHHAANRDYHYEYDGLLYNRLLSHYLFGGMSLLDRFKGVAKGKPAAINELAKKAVKNGNAQRQHIKQSQKVIIEEWRAKWM